ncbi:phosphate-starvation-inducible PsiE family protein [Pseudofulvibacter geojedonensis]|uniref:Phosphate-starvation-inducible PsiE family protein n=1 Tax=Pseudofulvibacter geojedonensis TaxID=1123758 RepID=A0ABW3I1M6_9FLAO
MDSSSKTILLFHKFEKVITIIVSVIIGFIIIISLLRVISELYSIISSDILSPQLIQFKDYQSLFGKIMTLLISLEFLNSILKTLKSHEIKPLVLDVCLITALAIARKLIIFDYTKNDPLLTISFGGILVSIGVFYFLIKHHALVKK